MTKTETVVAPTARSCTLPLPKLDAWVVSPAVLALVGGVGKFAGRQVCQQGSLSGGRSMRRSSRQRERPADWPIGRAPSDRGPPRRRRLSTAAVADDERVVARDADVQPRRDRARRLTSVEHELYDTGHHQASCCGTRPRDRANASSDDSSRRCHCGRAQRTPTEELRPLSDPVRLVAVLKLTESIKWKSPPRIIGLPPGIIAAQSLHGFTYIAY